MPDRQTLLRAIKNVLIFKKQSRCHQGYELPRGNERKNTVARAELTAKPGHNDRRIHDTFRMKADPDLRRWLPTALWDKMHPRATGEMVEYARGALETVADAIEKNLMDGSLKRVHR